MMHRRAALLAFALALASGCRGRGNDAESLQASGIAHRSKGEYDLAVADFDRVVAAQPKVASGYFNRGFTHQLAKHYDLAVQDFDRAIALKPDYVSAINSRGFAYQMNNDYPHAIESYDQALKLKPDLAIALKNRGRAHFYVGKFAESAADLEAGLRLDTANAFVVVWLHMVRQRLGAADTVELARQLARTDTAKWPAPVARLYLGRITAQQLAEGAAVGDSAAQQVQRCGAAFYVGEYLLWHRRVDEAKARFTEARSICPNDWSEYQGAVAELGRMSKP